MNMKIHDVELKTQGNVHPVIAGTGIYACGSIKNGVDMCLNEDRCKGSIVISFWSLTKWWFRALVFRVVHPVLWFRGSR